MSDSLSGNTGYEGDYNSGHNSAWLLKAVCSLLDFITISQYPIHGDDSLRSLNDALELFHEHKAIFIDLGICKDFLIPKLHFCRHYVDAILLYGSTDNYDTQYTEQLHIDFIKKAFRASNARDELFQMTTWMQRNEKVLQQECHITRQQTLSHAPSTNEWLLLLQPIHHMKLMEHASQPAVPLDSIISDYHATFIRDALARYIVQAISPTLTRVQIEHQSLYLFLPFLTLPIYHRIKFCSEDSVTIDSIHAQPSRKDRCGCTITGHFDTALVDVGNARASQNRNIHSTSWHNASPHCSNIPIPRLPRHSSSSSFRIERESYWTTFPITYQSSSVFRIHWMVHAI